MLRIMKPRLQQGIILALLAGFSACESCNCWDFGDWNINCGLDWEDGYDDYYYPDFDRGDFWDLPDVEDDVDVVDVEEESIPEECNGFDEDGNGVIDDADGPPYCGDECCNGGETEDTCPRDCICEEPSVPVLVSPRNGAKTTSRRPTFRWLASYGNCARPHYDFQVDSSCAMTDFQDCPFSDPEAEVENTPVVLQNPDHKPWSRFGCAVCTAGDLNADGVSDLVVGAEMQEGQEGAVLVYYGSESGLEPHDYFYLENQDPENVSSFGVSVGCIGDVNDDGFDDAAAGAPGLPGKKGEIFIYTGSKTGIRSYPDMTIKGPGQWFGYDIEWAGDVSRDDIDDFTVTGYSAAGLKQVLVFYGIEHYDALALP